MREITTALFAMLLIGVVLAGVAALADPPRPANCEPCGGEFKNRQPSSCGLLLAPVDAYRANGAFVLRYDNRCFACTSSGVFCTVPVNTQAR